MKIVQYVTQPSFELVTPLPTTMKLSIKRQMLTMMTLAQSLPVTAPGSPAVKGRVRVNFLSMTVQGNVTT